MLFEVLIVGVFLRHFYLSKVRLRFLNLGLFVVLGVVVDLTDNFRVDS